MSVLRTCSGRLRAARRLSVVGGRGDSELAYVGLDFWWLDVSAAGIEAVSWWHLAVNSNQRQVMSLSS